MSKARPTKRRLRWLALQAAATLAEDGVAKGTVATNYGYLTDGKRHLLMETRVRTGRDALEHFEAARDRKEESEPEADGAMEQLARDGALRTAVLGPHAHLVAIVKVLEEQLQTVTPQLSAPHQEDVRRAVELLHRAAKP